ncbi:MAG: IMP dehydrogenase [Nanoarchaeota archaeon]
MAIKMGLTFDDVLLVPKFSNITSRKDVDTSSYLTKNIKLHVPIVSANMDVVTESRMAISMARIGGIGFLHRFMSIEEETDRVFRVKRAETITVEKPFTLTPDKTLKDAKKLMQEHGVTGILITNNQNKLMGILTSRDIRFETDDSRIIKSIMTTDLITAPAKTSLDSAKNILNKNKIEKLPLVDSSNHLTGLITSRDILKRKEFPNASKDKKGRLMVGAAIGVKPGELERAKSLVNADVDLLVIDIAHGHSLSVIKMLRTLRKKFDIDIVAGNVATMDGVRDLTKAGADGIKVGIGGGSICTTRIVTGSGVPQLSAIMACSKAAAGKVPINADGGIRNSGDITKALASGASTVMLGSLLAGTDESPGIHITKDGKKYKMTRGMASISARTSVSKDTNDIQEYVAEGIDGLVHYRGSVNDIIQQLVGGLRSGMSYCGASSIINLQKNAEFVRISHAGLTESKSHDIEKM